MATPSATAGSVHFGDFELDFANAELRRNGSLVRLQPQPAKVLMILVSRAGQIVTRQQLAEEVWGSETFVDFEQGLNYAIRQIRTALQDDAEHPKFLETFPKRGYRFIATVTGNVPAVEAPASPPRPARFAFRYALLFLTIAAIAITLVVFLGLSHGTKSSTMSGRQIHSLAVLPLHNLSPDPEEEYFSEGMTDELITDLAKIGELKVISHTSVQRYKDTKLSLPEIAKELGVDAVIEGTVTRSGNQVRITAQLIDARTDQHLWAESYERDSNDILALQSEVAQQIADKVGIHLSEGDQSRLASNRAVDPIAHEAYLKGNFYWNRLTCPGIEKALDYYQQAIAKDANFAPAYLGVSDSYFTLLDWGCWPQDKGMFGKSQEAAKKALELDPNLAAVHELLGKIAFRYEWDWAKAEKEFTQAIALDSNRAHAQYAIFLVAMGKNDQGLAEMQKARELDPTSELTNMMSTYVFYLAHRFDEAINQGKKTLEMFPESGTTYHWIGEAYEAKGMNDQAMDAYLKAKVFGGVPPEEVAVFKTAYDKSGMRGYWQEQLKTHRTTRLGQCWKIVVYRHLKEKEQTLGLLDWSVQNHCEGLQTLKVDPNYDHLRDDPRFQQLLARLQL